MKTQILALITSCLVFAGLAADQRAEVKNLSLSGGLGDGKSRLIIEFNGLPEDQGKGLFSATLQDSIKISREKLTQNILATLDVLDGIPSEMSLTLAGGGEIRQVTGDNLLDWGVRQETNGTRYLVLRPRKTEKPLEQLVVRILVEQEVKALPATYSPLSLAPAKTSLLSGYLTVEPAPELDVRAENIVGLVPIETKLLPDSLKNQTNVSTFGAVAYRFQGAAYSLPLKIELADAEARRVVLTDFKLLGFLTNQTASFALGAVAHIKNPKGGRLELLSGDIALTGLEEHADWRLRFEQDHYVLLFEHAGEFPVQLKFHAKVHQGPEGARGWNKVDFKVAPSALQPVVLKGLAPDTQFEFSGAARTERRGNEFECYLPADGAIKLGWKEARPEVEGKLFYSVEMLSQISVSPGLMREVGLLDFKIMQGELNRVVMLLKGEGEVTRVQGEQVLAWNIEPQPGGEDRRLIVQFNQPQKDQFSLQVHMQMPLGAFPQTFDAMQLRPENATRFAGYFRVVNEGAVRLEVAQASGLSQISPEQFPESDAWKAALRVSGNQKFVYRFSGPEFALRIQADQILPELTVSQVLGYHLGENELDIDAEIELDIREAPLRELTLQVPKGYAIARLNAAGLSDYFLRELDGQTEAELRLVYAQPVTGRQLLQLRLERNQALGTPNWVLPRIEVAKAKSVRGHIGVSADAGFRLTPERTQALTEIATAFFPRKVAGLQSAFRMSEPAWQASLRVERMPQTVQADALHLFSIGEGIAYGSSVINYLISGAPVSVFKLELSEEYFNVEFSGKDIRSWQKSAGGYVVQLHTPVSGAYTLLATYERPFKTQGETLAFTGARPLDAQSEQGHTLITSAYQFQVKPVDVSSGLLPLETGEVPAEYRLFFDAPILAAYRYTTRPFNLRLALSPLVQGDSLSQVVDRAALTTHISKEGQILTDVRYFVKNRGNPNMRLTLAPGTQLWSATVNGTSVVPVTDGQANLIPLPQRSDPNAVLTIDLKLAARSADPAHVRMVAPSINAPIMLAEWKLEPDPGQSLEYHRGSLTPAGGLPDVTGFAQLSRTFMGSEAGRAFTSLGIAIALLISATLVWRWTAGPDVYRFSSRHVSGTVLGALAVVLAVVSLMRFSEVASHQRASMPGTVTLLAPVQQAGSALSAEVNNVAEKSFAMTSATSAWPVLFAVALWAWAWIADKPLQKTAAWMLGWAVLFWAVLRIPNGVPAFIVVLVAFVLFELALPAFRRMWLLPPKPQPANPEPPAVGTSPVLPLLLGIGLTLLLAGNGSFAAEAVPCLPDPNVNPLAQSVTQEIRIEDKFVLGQAHIRWDAKKGQSLPVLYEPAVLTRIDYSTNGLKLVQGIINGKSGQQLLADKDGAFEVDLEYQLQAVKREKDSGFKLPVQSGLINQLKLTVSHLDVDVVSPNAVSIQRESLGSNTVADLVLKPLNDVWLGWKPRSRDVKSEKTVFYAELAQLYAPAAGVVEGAHYVSIRPAQGELSELSFQVPKGTTITDVLDPFKAVAADNTKNQAPRGTASSLISLWRFDPDTQILRVTLSAPQSRPFALLIRSQVATGPLPLEQSLGLISVQGADGQIGLLGFATGGEVQLDAVEATTMSAINLEDFPPETVVALQREIPGLMVRRAFRYANTQVTASLRASPVEPDIRVETQDTLSLGEDRTVLAVNATVNITRAGIFRLSFELPTGFDVESVSGAAMSHWTEARSAEQRIITMHLVGRTEGQQQFAIGLAGPGLKATRGWKTPQLLFREATKQRGTLLLVPEQGMRLQVATREGVTQLDPQKSGVQQKGVLAFRILQTPWNLTLDLEQVDAWVQVNSLQHATVNEALVKVVANLQYQIENTGIKTLRLFIPTNAESVRFVGDQVADYLPVSGSLTNGLQQWEVKLHRRMIGAYLLQVNYQTLVPEAATETLLRGVRASDVNLQRGFVTIQAAGRLQVSVPALPEALQPTEWQSIPRVLQQDLQSASASFAYRLVEPTFQLPLRLERHEAAKLLPARVNSITLTSVISDDGIMLTQVRIDLLPGDKRLLNLTLPSEARFWFAFVNQSGVWPWRDAERILIPLEQQARSGKAIPVEFFYSSRIGAPSQRSLDLDLLAPKFDLPLENLTWRVSLSDKWKLKNWSGSLQLVQDQMVPQTTAVDLQTYFQNEANLQKERTREAEILITTANNSLQEGDPQQARRAFQAAYSLSTQDAAFNEDARVQLHNIKLQQALVGLNVRQAAAAGEVGALTSNLRDLRNRKELAYTQQDAKQIIERNSTDENAAFMRVAERLVQQQEAAVTSPAAIRASIPDQGRILLFRRAVVVDPWADLQLRLRAGAAQAAPLAVRFLVLAATFAILATLIWVAGAGRRVALKA